MLNKVTHIKVEKSIKHYLYLIYLRSSKSMDMVEDTEFSVELTEVDIDASLDET